MSYHVHSFLNKSVACPATSVVVDSVYVVVSLENLLLRVEWVSNEYSGTAELVLGMWLITVDSLLN